MRLRRAGGYTRPKLDCWRGRYTWRSHIREYARAGGPEVTDKPEEKARAEIDRLLHAAGWAVQDFKAANIHAAQGVALREFQLNEGYGDADYLLYIDARATGVIEAKKAGATLSGVERQSARYSKGLPESLPAWRRPLPFLYESTGFETHFTNGLDPEPRARNVFAFHRPDTLAGRWRVYGYDELVARDKASLDIFWLKDESLSESDNLPPPDVIAQEIVEDLEAALEQFRLIAGDLANGPAEKPGV